MANSSNVGKQVSTSQPAQGTHTHTATPAQNPQPLVANGLAFYPSGRRLFVADTARGAIWKVEFERDGSVESERNCDETFSVNTLCLNHQNIFVAHPLLEGADGIVLDIDGNIWVDANERNAVVFVTKDGKVFEVFQNSLQGGLRNAGPLEFPASPFINQKTFCTSNSDGNRRDNSPHDAGEIHSDLGNARGKISCMDQELIIQGLPLPLRP